MLKTSGLCSVHGVRTTTLTAVGALLDNGLGAGGLPMRVKIFDAARADTDKPIPPRITTEEINKRTVICSDKNATPPRAAIIGTESCTVAARVAVSRLSTAYQMA